MGYTTQFSGQVSIEPPLNHAEIEYLRKFNTTRRMKRGNGPYFVDGSGDFGQGRDSDVVNYNSPPTGQPGLWCNWTVTDDGSEILWDEGEKFYYAKEWMAYIIEHFLKPGAVAASALSFLQANHVCNGVIKAQGEDMDDRWKLIVVNNFVSTEMLE